MVLRKRMDAFNPQPASVETTKPLHERLFPRGTGVAVAEQMGDRFQVVVPQGCVDVYFTDFSAANRSFVSSGSIVSIVTARCDKKLRSRTIDLDLPMFQRGQLRDGDTRVDLTSGEAAADAIRTRITDLLPTNVKLKILVLLSYA